MLAAELDKTESLISSLWDTWGAAASLAVAAVALLVSVSQARTAKNALRLAVRQDERSRARLEINLRDAVDWIPDQTSRWIGVRLLVLNSSDSQGALTEAELSISYRAAVGKILVLRVRYESTNAHLPDGVSGMTLPMALANNGAVEGWLTFKIHNSLLDHSEVESYNVTLYDSRGISMSLQPITFRRVQL